MYNDYRDYGFVALAINLSEDMNSVVKVYARQNTNPYLRDNGTVWGIYRQNNYIPLNYVVDTAGIIRFWQEGFDENTIKQYIEQYLPGQIDHDVGVMGIAAPSGSLDSGASAVPICSVYNYGPTIETYAVRVRIGDHYDTTAMVENHQPNTIRRLSFPEWVSSQRGQLAVTCTTELAGDDIGSNNAMRGIVTVNVYDVAATAILAPVDSVDSGAAVAPAVEIKNLGTQSDMAKVKFFIGTTYVESVSVAILAGRTDTVELRTWTPTELGTFAMRCTLTTFRPDMNLANNLLTGSIRVVHPSGIEEPNLNRARLTQLEAVPNPGGPRTTIRYSLPHAGPVELRIYSSNGKLVRTFGSGRKEAGSHEVAWDGCDESGRPAGLGAYYCRLAAGGERAIYKFTLVR